MIDSKNYREGMSRLGAAVNIVTTSGQAGQGGFTASAVCSVTDSPPTLLVCMNRNSKQTAIFKSNGVLCVNVLAPAHEELSGIFAGVRGLETAERFKAAAWRKLITGAPVLADAAVSFDCNISEINDVGTHSVFICPVQAICIGEEPYGGLIYFARRYHHLHDS